MIELLPYFLFVHLVLIIPGYAFIKKLGLLSKHPGAELCLGYAVSISFLFLFSILGYIFDFSSWVNFSLSWAALVVGSYYLFRIRVWKNTKTLIFPVLCVVMMSTFSSTFVTLTFPGNYQYVPDPEITSNRDYDTFSVKILNVAQTQANDNYIPYRQAQFIYNNSNPAHDSFIDEWGVHFFQRTPLMGAVTASFFHMLKDDPPVDYTWSVSSEDTESTYLKFQLIAHVLNSIFLVPCFFLLKGFFNRKVARLSLLFIVINPFFLYNSFFSWPKSLVAFFILTSWLLLFYTTEKSKLVVLLAGAMAGLAYLSHDLAILYIGAGALVLILGREFTRALVYSSVSLVFALPWMFVSKFIYNKPSSFILYPFSIQGIPQTDQSKEVVREFLSTSPIRIASIKFESITFLISPYQLIVEDVGQSLIRKLRVFTLFSVPGSLGVGLFVPVVIAAFKKLATAKFLILTLAPILFAVLLIGWPRGLGSFHFAQTSVALLVGLGLFYLVKLRSLPILLVVLGLNVLQLLAFMLLSYNFAITEWINLRDLVAIFIIMGVILLTCLSIIYTYTDKPSILGRWRT